MSCCCDCCSSSYQYWNIPSTATCLLTGIQRLEEGQTLESVCPVEHPSGECISPGNYQAPEKYRRETNPVKGGQCASNAPEQITTEKKCYVCHDCLPACSGDINSCLPTPDPCLEGQPYNCRKNLPFGAVWAAAPCFSAVQVQCQFCNANPRPDAEEDPEGAAQWDATCSANLGTCHSAPASYCFTGNGPLGCGYYSEYPEHSPFAVDDCPDCPDKGAPCGGGGPCTTPGHIECPVPCTAGPDTCGNYYTGCDSICVGGSTTFCCPATSPNNCAGYPPECIFC